MVWDRQGRPIPIHALDRDRESDIAGNGTYSQFRLRFSREDGNSSGASDYVDFETGSGVDCAGDAALAPILIVTY
ncbi:MAG TPA: hypothetical protein VNW46_12335 [Gemmatimonadaceae bacterium]|nr:hypothetical protein [Gemmatimonadaceae bacterium]